MLGRDDGGGITSGASTGIGGPAPSVQTANPLAQNQIQRYQGMSAEQLQELVARLGPSSQGQMAQRILQQKRMQPAPAATAPQTFDGGGGISASEGSPWWTRQEARGADSGFLHGSTPGRADSVNTTAPGGSYILPADVVAGLGEGNSLAGARVADAMFSTGPHGISLPRGGKGMGIPRPPPAFREQVKNGGPIKLFNGGSSRNAAPVMLSHGEYVIPVETCRMLGGGDAKRGHKILDKWVVDKRAEIIKTMKTLPGPVRT